MDASGLNPMGDALDLARRRSVLPIGGVFRIQFLTLPPPAKLMNGWLIRPVTKPTVASSEVMYPAILRGGGSGMVAGAVNPSGADGLGYMSGGLQDGPRPGSSGAADGGMGINAMRAGWEVLADSERRCTCP